MPSSSPILLLPHVGSFCPFLWAFLCHVWVLLLPFVGCFWWSFSRSMWVFGSQRALQQPLGFGRQWGFLLIRDFISYPLGDLGVTLSTPFEEPLQNRLAFVCHGADSPSYWLLGWDLVSIPPIELLKLLSCLLLCICCWFLCSYIWIHVWCFVFFSVKLCMYVIM